MEKQKRCYHKEGAQFASRMFVFLGVFFLGLSSLPAQSAYTPERVEALKAKVIKEVDKRRKLTQEIVDMVFSYSELGMQEFETKKYITSILRKEGFTINEQVAGIPSAWIATFGSGKPVIVLGGDVDCIPKASQKPGVAYHDPIVEGAPGHGEGHNASQGVNTVAALAVKDIMISEKLPGTLVVIPGIAEEQLATKSYLIRDGHFKDVDVCLFTHVGSKFNVMMGENPGNGLISVEFMFEGVAAHGAAAPWRGKSALDAVELMNAGWNFAREHLYITQRSHYVITDGGDQPNVVPSKASVWYYFRERDYKSIMNMYQKAMHIAEGAAMMTDTKMTYRILGSAWPQHYNVPVAKVVYENARKVGLPEWNEADQTLAKALQKEVGTDVKGLEVVINEIKPPAKTSLGGGSNDLGDITWTVPTVTMFYPANIPGLQGHHWSNSVSMATPIAHKGSHAGAQAIAMTVVDLMTHPAMITDAWEYYNKEQTKDIKFVPMISDKDKPAVHLNSEIMAEFIPKLKKYYYDPTKYSTYMEQLGISYPTVKKQP